MLVSRISNGPAQAFVKTEHPGPARRPSHENAEKAAGLAVRCDETEGGVLPVNSQHAVGPALPSHLTAAWFSPRTSSSWSLLGMTCSQAAGASACGNPKPLAALWPGEGQVDRDLSTPKSWGLEPKCWVTHKLQGSCHSQLRGLRHQPSQAQFHPGLGREQKLASLRTHRVPSPHPLPGTSCPFSSQGGPGQLSPLLGSS